MSWTAAGRVDLGAGSLDLAYSPPVEQMDEGPAGQARIAEEAVRDLLDDGYFGDAGVLSVSLNGHSNPGHALGEEGNEYLGISIFRVE